jgi:S1-C subfamily serine protease
VRFHDCRPPAAKPATNTAHARTGALRIAAALAAGVIISSGAGAQEIPLSSVFLVSQSVRLQDEQVRDTPLFERLEKALGRKVLNERFAVVTGSGFLVSREVGVTAFHVVRPLSADQKNAYALSSFTKLLARYLIPGQLSAGEINRVLLEYQRAVKSVETDVAIRFAEGAESPAPVLDTSSDLDLALLRIDNAAAGPPIALRSGVDMKVGDPVTAVGFPLQTVLDRFLRDFKPTATNGIVSALRSDKWDVQHTAAINPGNSGGPLLTKDGRLAGINLGTVRNANQLYFALSTGRLVDWLKKTGRQDMVPKEGTE